METSGFWDNKDKANAIMKEKAGIERSLKDWNSLSTRFRDLEAMAELAAEEGGEAMRAELEREIASIQKDISAAEIAALLSGEQDITNAIVSIHPGAGGTEAQDWAEMLMRMYLRWAEARVTRPRSSTIRTAKKRASSPSPSRSRATTPTAR